MKEDQFERGDLVWFKDLNSDLEVLATITRQRPTIFDTKTFEPIHTYDIICATGEKRLAWNDSIERATKTK